MVCVPPLKLTVPVKVPVNEPKGLDPVYWVLIVPVPATPPVPNVKVLVPRSKVLPLFTVRVLLTVTLLNTESKVVPDPPPVLTVRL